MGCSHQCKPKSKASFSFADLVSFVFLLFSMCPLKPAVFRDLRKTETLCKFADSMPENTGLPIQRLKEAQDLGGRGAEVI